MIFKAIKGVFYYSTTAVKATVSAIKEKVFYTNPLPSNNLPGVTYHYPSLPSMALSVAAYGFWGGAIVWPVGLAAIVLTPAILKARQNYISALAQTKIASLTDIERKEIDDGFEIEQKRIAEVTKMNTEFSTHIKSFLSSYLPNFKIQQPLLFRLSKEGKSFFILGTYHCVPFDNLPDFVKDKFSKSLNEPNALMVGEANPQENPKFFEALKIILKTLGLFLKNFASPRSILTGLIEPWYLNAAIQTKYAYRILKAKEMISNKGFIWAMAVTLIDFLKPGTALLLSNTSDASNMSSTAEMASFSKGMDHHMIHRINPKNYTALEGISEMFNAEGIMNASKLQPSDIEKLLELLAAVNKESAQTAAEIPKVSTSKEKTEQVERFKKKCAEIFDTYSRGNLAELQGLDYSTAPVERSNSVKEVFAELEKLGIEPNKDAWLAARNFNWFAKLLPLFQRYSGGFIFVGIKHLTDITGLLNLFVQEGYTVDRVIGENQYAPEESLTALQNKSVQLSLQTHVPLMHEKSLLYYDTVKKRNRSCRNCCVANEELVSVNITKNGKIKLE